ncbi:MAG: hypothetical protein K2V38_11755, partial [Gemmataceae bacterium]|nr:hypothetical protein [Gemmataceae bacterium]
MPTVFDCPECDRPLRVPDDLAGQMVRCPHCKALAAVPRPVAEELEASETLNDEPEVVQPIAFTFDDRGRMWV